MRSLMIVLSLVIGLGAAAAAPVAYQPGGFPRDEVSLRALDNAQLRIVRRAWALCWHHGPAALRSAGAVARACIISETESMMSRADDAALVAFHKALPFFPRYDQFRPAYYWQRMVQA